VRISSAAAPAKETVRLAVTVIHPSFDHREGVTDAEDLELRDKGPAAARREGWIATEGEWRGRIAAVRATRQISLNGPTNWAVSVHPDTDGFKGYGS
jgi:hypothetical protein